MNTKIVPFHPLSARQSVRQRWYKEIINNSIETNCNHKRSLNLMRKKAVTTLLCLVLKGCLAERCSGSFPRFWTPMALQIASASVTKAAYRKLKALPVQHPTYCLPPHLPQQQCKKTYNYFSQLNPFLRDFQMKSQSVLPPPFKECDDSQKKKNCVY